MSRSLHYRTYRNAFGRIQGYTEALRSSDDERSQRIAEHLEIELHEMYLDLEPGACYEQGYLGWS